MAMITQSACEQEANKLEGCELLERKIVPYTKKSQESSCYKLKRKKVLSKGTFLNTIFWFDIT